MKIKNIFETIKIIILGLVISVGIGYVLAAGTPPAGNVSGPLNLGPSTQTKIGKVTFSGGLSFSSSPTGKLGAVILPASNFTPPNKPDYTYWDGVNTTYEPTGMYHPALDTIAFSTAAGEKLKINGTPSLLGKTISDVDVQVGTNLFVNSSSMITPYLFNIGADNTGTYVYTGTTKNLSLGVNSSRANLVVSYNASLVNPSTNGSVALGSFSGGSKEKVICANNDGELIVCP